MKSGQTWEITPASSESPCLHAPSARLCKHDVQFYFDDRFLIRSLLDFVQRALDTGSSAIVIATRAHRVTLAEHLRSHGFALSAAIDSGRYVSMDAAETLDQFMVDGIPDEKRFERILGDVISCSLGLAPPDDDKVVIFSEMVGLLGQRGKVQSALDLEHLWNQLSEHCPFQMRCAYPIACFNQNAHRELFHRICDQHESIIPAEGYSEAGNDNDRLHTIALLQQTEQALKIEATERRLAEDEKREIQTYNQKLLKEIRKHEAIEAELRKFTRRLLTARDEEQRRIAAELHENTAQLVAALSLYFGVMYQEKASLNPRLAGVVANSRSVSDSLLREIRKLSYLLHPPTLDDMGLASALQEYVDQFAISSGVSIHLDISKDLGRFNHNLEIMVFRVIEEALASVPRSKHSFATVRLSRSTSTLMLEIENRYPAKGASDGPPRPETRFTGIHERVMERGGSVHFTSSSSGMLVSVELPLEDSLAKPR